MTNYIVYLKKIRHAGDSIGKQLSFKITVGNESNTSVGGNPSNKRITTLHYIPSTGTVNITIEVTEKDKISDKEKKTATLCAKESNEFQEQNIDITVKGIGGDAKRTATFTLVFYVDIVYESSSSLHNLIEKFEGYRPAAYRDRGSAGYPTIGIGHRINIVKEKHLLTATLSRTQAIEILKKDLATAEKAVNDLVKVPINQNKFDALVSLVFNIGRSGFANSKLLKVINSKGSKSAISKEWAEFVKSQGVVLKGLQNRRNDEITLYFK